jgi:hypothetical protein
VYVVREMLRPGARPARRSEDDALLLGQYFEPGYLARLENVASGFEAIAKGLALK